MPTSTKRKAPVKTETDATPTSTRLARSKTATTSTAPSEGENLHETKPVKTKELELLRDGADAEEDENEERKARRKKKSTGRKKNNDSSSSKKKVKIEEPLLSSAVKTEEDGDLSGCSELCGDEDEVEEGCGFGAGEKKMLGRGNKNPVQRKDRSSNSDEEASKFVGEPVPEEEAKTKWPERYPSKKLSGRSITSMIGGVDEKVFVAKCHYQSAKVDTCTYHLNDDVYVQADPGKPHYIGRIVEFFESTDGELYFTAQWFFRVEDTAIGSVVERHITHDPRRVFLSEEKNENILDCIVHKIHIIQRDPQDKKPVPSGDFYYDMSYSVQYTSFANLPHAQSPTSSEDSSTLSFDDKEDTNKELTPCHKLVKVLDLYAGCGAMSTGLCHGARLAGMDIDTTWAVDINSDACSSLQLNHPNTKVRNENAEDFLKLLKEWEKLCATYGRSSIVASEQADDENDSNLDSGDVDDEEFVVEKLLDICHGDPAATGNVGVKFKVRWKGYGPEEDTWEPIDSLGNCEESIEQFVKLGMMNSILPLPGDVDVICGGPPCQGISGFNRFRNFASPLEDTKNRQMLTYMEIVDHLKPKYVLMENVVDILKFSAGFLGRYALSFLVSRKYQARLGIMAAGCYGLPQFRLRVFLWGAHASEKLPQFPLPTHDVVVRSGIPNEFEQNLVGYNEGEPRNLKKALLLEDAISDLPSVTNFEDRDEMPYDQPPKTEFQRLIRTPENGLASVSSKQKNTTKEHKLFDHRPLKLNTDDYQRVQQIPKHKGANFRNLPGLRVGLNNVVELDPSIERALLPSGKPLVPDYAISFIKGKSLKPFARLWWDETVATVVTRAEPHNQKIIHPLQDRVLTVRENARLQGFPDYYQLRGSTKERYIQVGNAVAFPVSRALGYSLGLAYTKCASDNDSRLKLPFDFPSSL